ncbi:MAG TPA: hypothetical protein VIL00_09475 [Pseudonocardiaceae bacterium]
MTDMLPDLFDALPTLLVAALIGICLGAAWDPPAQPRRRWWHRPARVLCRRGRRRRRR